MGTTNLIAYEDLRAGCEFMQLPRRNRGAVSRSRIYFDPGARGYEFSYALAMFDTHRSLPPPTLPL